MYSLNFTPMVCWLLISEYFRIIVIIYHVRSEITESCLFANFTQLWWTGHEVAWFTDDVTFFIFEILLDVNSFLLMLKHWFVTKFHDLWRTENFLVSCSQNFIIILFSAHDSLSNLLEGLTARIVCKSWQQNWVDCGSFLDRLRSDLLWSSDYMTFFITASYVIQMLALLFSEAFYVTAVTANHYIITYLSLLGT